MMCGPTHHYNETTSISPGQYTSHQYLSIPTRASQNSSSMPLTISLWNANGLQASTVGDLIQHCQSFSLIFITETWLLSPHRIRFPWSQFNIYGSPVARGFRGSQGISALVSPSCPMAVVQFPFHTKYGLGLRLDRSLRLICLYLPPSLSPDEVSSELISTSRTVSSSFISWNKKYFR